MKKYKVSKEGLQDSLQRVEKILFKTAPDELSEDIQTAETAMHTFLEICNMVEQGCGIVDIRKLINLYPATVSKKKTNIPSNQSNSRPTPDFPSKDSSANEGDGNQEEDKNHGNGENKNHNGKRGAYDFENVAEEHCQVLGLKEKDPCPSCPQGRLYKHVRNDGRPRAAIWFTGQSPISAKRYVFHDLRCNFCKKVFPAEPPQSLVNDGWGKEERIGYSAIATLSILKYFSALPWYRLSKLQDTYNLPFSDSCQWDQVEKMGNAMKALYDYWKKDGVPKAKSYFGDDTSNSIRDKTCEVIDQRGTNKPTLRDGCHSSVIVSVTEEQHHIVLIKTDIIHLGEWFDEVLVNRPDNLPAPLVMGDCSSNNKITAIDTIPIACNQHARKPFKELKNQFPKQCKTIIRLYKEIFRNDRKTQKMDDKERLDYHVKHSTPLMDKIHDHITTWIEDKIAPENSPFGKALSYFINHEKELRGFLHHEGAAICNNISERQMIQIALLRNNSKTFLTMTGAQVASGSLLI